VSGVRENGVTVPRPKGPLTLSDALSSRVLSILWANWEDPFSQTVKEIQAGGVGVIENNHSPDVESPSPPPRVCMSNHPEVKACSDLDSSVRSP